ncbi:MAG: hypothetical protein ACXWLR_03500 [Myxococcales bacterium]
MACREPLAFEPGSFPEPGPDLDRRLALLEQQVRERMAGTSPAGAETTLVSGREVLLLIACVRDLLRDRDALLEEIEALECGAGRPRAS